MESVAQRLYIAETIGWHHCHGTGGVPCGIPPTVKIISDDFQQQVPQFLSDLNITLQLVDFLADKGWRCEIANGLDKTWECEFWKPATETTHPDVRGTRQGEKGEMEIHYGPADTLAEAICQAFLRAVGKWEEDEET